MPPVVADRSHARYSTARRVVYSESMVAPAQGYSPSAQKPHAVMAAWRTVWPDLLVRPPVAATLEEICRAHEARYVTDVLANRIANGFGTVSPAVSDSLPYTSGAMLTAARWALSERGAVAAPVSGFHHAGWDSGEGFCTFNGLMVAALTLQADQPGLRVGILDYDYHYGNGTDDILDTLGCRDIVHVTAGEHWKRPEQATDFLDNITHDVDRMAECDVVLYQAGADPHIDDPLGGFLTTTQLATRDWKVFDGLKRLGVPIAWNLGGGYQQPLSKVVEIHVNSLRAAIEAGAGV